jgi:hypothetical protein
MTLLVVLFLGAGAILVASAIESDPKTGENVSILKTLSGIWNNTADFSQPAQTQGNLSPASNGAGSTGSFGTPLATSAGGPGGTVNFVGSGGAAGNVAYRQSVVRAWVQSRLNGAL